MYNCHHDGDQYRITKFSSSGDVQSSYLCDHVNCECPAGVRDTCRHRQMLPAFLEQGLVNSHLFLDWDRGRHVVDFNGHPALPPATVRSNESAEPDLYGTAPHITAMGLAPQALTDTEAQFEPEPIEPGIYTITQPNEAGEAEIVNGHHRGRKITLPPAAWRRF
jgi:hypothetical protein